MEFFPDSTYNFFPYVPLKLFFFKGNLKGTFSIPKMISEGTKLVFIGPMQGLLLSFIVIAASKFVVFFVVRKEYGQKCESGTKIVPCAIIYTGENLPSRYFFNFCVKMVGIWYLFF